MGKKSRDKGANFERWVANQLKQHWPDARRRGNAQADGRKLEADVEGVPGWHIECKRYATMPSWNQCKKWFVEIPHDTVRKRLLIVKADRQQPIAFVDSSRGMVCQPFVDWITYEHGI